MTEKKITHFAKKTLSNAVVNPRYVGKEAQLLTYPKVGAMMKGKGIDRVFRDYANNSLVLRFAKKTGLIKLNPTNRGADMIGGKCLKNKW